MSDHDDEKVVVDTCLELARERYDGPVRINLAKCGDGMWSVDVVQDLSPLPSFLFAVVPQLSTEKELLHQRGTGRIDALRALQQSLRNMPAKRS